MQTIHIFLGFYSSAEANSQLIGWLLYQEEIHVHNHNPGENMETCEG